VAWSGATAALPLDLLAKLMDQAPARAIEARQQTAPDMTAGPKPFACDGIIDSQIGIGGPVTKMEGQIRSEASVLGRTGEGFRFNLGGKDDYQIRLLTASNNLEAAPSLELAEGIATNGREPGLVLEIDEFCR